MAGFRIYSEAFQTLDEAKIKSENWFKTIKFTHSHTGREVANGFIR